MRVATAEHCNAATYTQSVQIEKNREKSVDTQILYCTILFNLSLGVTSNLVQSSLSSVLPPEERLLFSGAHH